jgi:hypothetical protein
VAEPRPPGGALFPIHRVHPVLAGQAPPTPAALARPLDLSTVGLGQQSVLFVLTALLANVSLHCGEISCLKGLQGLQEGYPM